MALPLITYDPGTGNVTLQCKRGPVDFRCFYDARAHDNLATSGLARERVTEAVDTLVTFAMPHLVVNDDLEAWAAFARHWLTGKTFSLSPNSDLADYCTCVSDDTRWEPARTGPWKYAASFRWRMVGHFLTPDVVLKRFHGVTG